MVFIIIQKRSNEIFYGMHFKANYLLVSFFIFNRLIDYIDMDYNIWILKKTRGILCHLKGGLKDVGK